MKDKVFMSWQGHRIWYRLVDGKAVFMVAKGDGTDEYFAKWEDAAKYIEHRWGKK
jgi:hypothetical protein